MWRATRKRRAASAVTLTQRTLAARRHRASLLTRLISSWGSALYWTVANELSAGAASSVTRAESQIASCPSGSRVA